MELVELKENVKTEYWTKIIQDQLSSNIGPYDYCKQNNIATSTFFKWRRKLLQSKADDYNNQIIVPLEMPSKNQSSPIIIRKNDVEIEINDASMFKEIIGQLI